MKLRLEGDCDSVPCREKPPWEGMGPSGQGLGGLGRVAGAFPVRMLASRLEQQHAWGLKGGALDRLIRDGIESICARPERPSEPHLTIVGVAVGF